MKAPLVTIVLPYHNREAYIGDALDSLAAQSYPYIELILADDASDDGGNYRIKNALKRSGRRYIRFQRVKTKRYVGVAKIVNAAMEKASGIFVGILFAEDRFQPERIERMIGLMRELRARIAFADCKPIDTHGRAIAGPLLESIERMQGDWIYERSLSLAAIDQNPTLCAGNLMMRKTMWEELGGMRYHRPCCEWDLFLRATLICEPLYVPNAPYELRLLGKSLARLDANPNERRKLLTSFQKAIEKGRFENAKVAEHRAEIQRRIDRALRAGTMPIE